MIRALGLLIACTFLAGCYFDRPLTERPSKDLNSWLLGVWEHKDQKGRKFRARVVPWTGDRYAIALRGPGKSSKVRETEFEGWISRVGPASFLTLKCVSDGGVVPNGGFVFVHYQVIDQNTVFTRPLELDSPSDTPSIELRKEVRHKFKEGTLLPHAAAAWKRISEVYWEPGYTGEQPFQPLRFPPDAGPAPIAVQREAAPPRDQRRQGSSLLPMQP